MKEAGVSSVTFHQSKREELMLLVFVTHCINEAMQNLFFVATFYFLDKTMNLTFIQIYFHFAYNIRTENFSDS